MSSPIVDGPAYLVFKEVLEIYLVEAVGDSDGHQRVRTSGFKYQFGYFSFDV